MNLQTMEHKGLENKLKGFSEDGFDSMGEFYSDIRKRPLLTKEEEQDISKRIQKGDTTALNNMVEANLRLVVSIAKKFPVEKDLTLSDHIQNGIFGLFTAARKFNYRMGFKFSTYATSWIKQSIERAKTNSQDTIRKPVYLYEAHLKLDKYFAKVMKDEGRTPSIMEAHKSTGENMERIEELRNRNYFLDPVSLNMEVGEGREYELIDLIEDTASLSPYEQAENNIIKMDVGEMLDILPRNYKEVIIHRFGILPGEDYGKDKTLEEAGKIMGFSRERARQIEESALKILKKSAEEKGCKGWLD